MLAVELFERTDGELLVNELAMRPHNSGHWTIEGARTSQFEQHLRAVLDYPLGATGMTAPAVAMANVLAGRADGPGLDERLHHLAARWPERQGPPVREAAAARPQARARDGARRRPRPAPAGRDRGGGVPGDRSATRGAPVTDPLVGVIMGSDSDWPVMSGAAEVLREFGVAHEVRVVSAHRTPRDMVDYAGAAVDRGLRVIVAGAGGAAHLPGMVASLTPLPVIGVPVPLQHLDGLDSLLSIVQMPAGIPVATVSVGGGRNAGLLAVRILGAADATLRARLVEHQAALAETARAKDASLRRRLSG